MNSDIGSYVATKMESGNIIVSGSVENFAGAEMKGGFLLIKRMQENFLPLVCQVKKWE